MLGWGLWPSFLLLATQLQSQINVLSRYRVDQPLLSHQISVRETLQHADLQLGGEFYQGSQRRWQLWGREQWPHSFAELTLSQSDSAKWQLSSGMGIWQRPWRLLPRLEWQWQRSDSPLVPHRMHVQAYCTGSWQQHGWFQRLRLGWLPAQWLLQYHGHRVWARHMGLLWQLQPRWPQPSHASLTLWWPLWKSRLRLRLGSEVSASQTQRQAAGMVTMLANLPQGMWLRTQMRLHWQPNRRAKASLVAQWNVPWRQVVWWRLQISILQREIDGLTSSIPAQVSLSMWLRCVF